MRHVRPYLCYSKYKLFAIYLKLGLRPSEDNVKVLYVMHGLSSSVET